MEILYKTNTINQWYLIFLLIKKSLFTYNLSKINGIYDFIQNIGNPFYNDLFHEIYLQNIFKPFSN